ncbi:MAG: response regulator [Armatimonadota bacterium]|nr:response regulator [Armatimonadota bacterium]
MKHQWRILVVDDQPANLTLVRRVLEPAGFEVREARSGAETLAVAQEATPDLVLLDMHLPDMHGLDVLRRLRENPRTASLRVVAMSALATPEDRDLWLEAGCVGTIEKPINVRQFPQEVGQWLPGAKPPQAGTAAVEEDRPDKLGELLVANLLISPEQLARAVAAQAGSGKRLGQVLVEQGALSEDDIAWALSHQLGYPYVFLTPDIIDGDAVGLLPEAFLRERRILPILKFGEEMTLAMVDPTDQKTVEEVVARTGLQVKRALALSSNVEEMQNRFFGHAAASRVAVAAPTAATEAQYFQFHVVQALQQGGTEIHFDPGGDGQARVRYRLQGVLVDRPGQPADLHRAIVHHLRQLTGASEVPAGTATATLTVGEKDILLVATFLATIAGEAATVVMHPLHADAPHLGLLGVSDDLVESVRRTLDAAAGVVVVGCADRWVRSTLVHGLVPLGSRGKVWSLEHAPVYRRSTINQTVLDPRTSVVGPMLAAAGAGADLIAVDDASARDALTAVLETGRTRVVLAGHAESDVASVLGEAVEAAGPALVASTLRGIVTARVIRLLCPSCKQPVNGDGGPFGGARTFVPSGCEACGFTGFKGRRLLTETWFADAESRRHIRAGRLQAVFDLMAQAISQMREAGRALVLDGLTSAEEFARVAD